MDLMSSPRVTNDEFAQPEPKRRRLRKGTHSCWECKRRKMKCIFDPNADSSICNGCRRRGSQCVTQEFPEELSNTTGRAQSVVGVSSTPRTPSLPVEEDGPSKRCIPTSVPITQESVPHLAFYETSQQQGNNENAIRRSANHAPAASNKHGQLSRFLHSSLPSREVTKMICDADRHPSVLPHEIMTMPYAAFSQDNVKGSESLLEVPSPEAHPVLIAKYMLLLATRIQHLRPDLHKAIEGVPESPRAIMHRIADLAIKLVTTNDELLGSIEGLECVVIEAVYQASIGNLRRSWVTCRRAMSIAQLMGLSRSDESTRRYKVLDHKTKCHPQIMWFRIVFLDRQLCLMLGLSQGSLDRSMASEEILANDTPIGRLERIHCAIASQILERDESSAKFDDIGLTGMLDVELQKAARSLPSKWWLTPTLDVNTTDKQSLFWDTRRLFAQVVHYNLLNQLHLPYMLRSSSTDRKYEYSRITCINASREILSRFTTLRSFNGIAYSCRLIDFLALMAAMTLIIAHLNSSLLGSENLLSHQYHSDRAMIEQVQENMEEVNRLNSDALSEHSADLLRQLLEMEAETSDDAPRGSRRVSVQQAGVEPASSNQEREAVVSVHIPYFGIIQITREGISKQVFQPSATIALAAATATATAKPRPMQPSYPSKSNKASAVNAGTLYPMSSLQPLKSAGPNRISSVEIMTPNIHNGSANYYHHRNTETPSIISDTYATTEAPSETFSISTPGAHDPGSVPFTPQFHGTPSSAAFDPLWQYGEWPELAAGGDDWAFQGVDLAFFESIMRSAGEVGSI